MRSESIKNLVLDFGGVLIGLNRERCIQNFKDLGFNDVEHYIDNRIFEEYEKGLVSTEQFREEIRCKADKNIKDKDIDFAWNSFLEDIPKYKLDLLLRLREKYVVYLLSNTNPLHWDFACQNVFPYKGFHMDNYFEKAYLSFELNEAKPDNIIYQKMIDEAGILPKETLFIDDMEENCKAANALGIHTYLAKPHENWSHLF